MKQRPSFVILHIHEEDDENFHRDVLCTKLLKDGKLVFEGDWYHDKIDSKIDGYLLAVEHLTGQLRKVDVQRIHDDGTYC